MPPGGLYPLPRHHIYGGQMARPTFNSMDYQDEPVDGGATTDPIDANGAHQEDDEKQRNKKKKKKRSLGKDKNTDGDVGHEKRKRKKDKQKEERDTPDHHSSKKRKRDGEAHAQTPVVRRSETANGSFVVGNDLVENVKASMNGVGHQFEQASGTPRSVEKLSKRKKKKSSKKSELITTDTQHEPKASSRASPSVVAEKTKAKKHKRKSLDGIDAVQEKIHARAPTPVMKSTPRKTPIPLPQAPQLSVSSMRRQVQPQRGADHSSTTEVLVLETPPPKAARKDSTIPRTIIPYPLSQPVGATTTGRKTSRKERVTVLLSTPTSADDLQTPVSAPAALAKQRNGIPKPRVANALTDANLERFTQPLNDEPKPRPRPRAGLLATSLIPESTASSMSIEEAFSRVQKPSQSKAVRVPFVSPGARKTKHPATHEEATMFVFNERFQDVQKTVNFTEERQYLEKHLAWGAGNETDQLPCLGKATGCTPKKEEILRLSREENMNILPHLETGSDSNALMGASMRAQNAEEFLLMAVHAHVPVPIGCLEGTWTLYCPKYAETHYDRYGFGQRTLAISSIAGFKHKNSYTARLNIPPRSMAYSILAFSTPPHASFRTTTIKTAAEGYTMEVVFLGNGYLQLRVDLNLLLRGKATEEIGGKELHMEFVGVHEKAVQWVQTKNEPAEESTRA